MATDNSKFARFDNIISSLDAVRRVLREPMHSVVAKQIDHIDGVCKAIIEKSPFVVAASASDRGYPDISPKGDPADFVRILDEKYSGSPRQLQSRYVQESAREPLSRGDLHDPR